jgi:hypothetical protein
MWDEEKSNGFYINEKGKEEHRKLKGTKEKTNDFDLFLSGCELGCLFVAGSCVSEIGGVAWCE